MANTLKINNNLDFISYFLHVNPELREEIDLPIQGDNPARYGEIIMSNERYKNAFINTINLIGLTLIKRNEWDNPWESFANRGTLKMGQQIREMIQDLAKVFDYNKNYDNKLKFLDTAVPNVFTYIHEINFQKVYHVTINETLLTMAFDSEAGLIDFTVDTIANLYETFKYDKYQADKYQLARRLLNGTVTPIQIVNYESLTPRQILTKIKGTSNKMTFRKPLFNPAGVRRATKFENQITLLDTEKEAEYTTDILSQSYFRNDAELKTNLALIDGFEDLDEARLTELLEDDFTPFTEDEKTQLSNVVAMVISDRWFMDFYKALDTSNTDGKRQIEFINPTTLERNVFLHVQMVLSTSPFENAFVVVKNTPAISSVSVSPATATVSAGQDLKLSANVVATGMANKSVVWSLATATEGLNATINQEGVLKVPAGAPAGEITVTATSVYDDTKTATATITVVA